MSTRNAQTVQASPRLTADKARKAKRLHEAGKVVQSHRKRLGEIVIITGVVEDDQALRRAHAVIDGEHFDGDCSCGARESCEHLGAIWLALQSAGTSATSTQHERNAAARDYTLRYLVRLSQEAADLSVCPVRSASPGPGLPPTTTPFMLSRLNEKRQPAYLTESDLVILHELADRPDRGQDAIWHPIPPGAGSLLEKIIATDRAHFDSATGPQLSLAEPVSGRLHWRPRPDGWQVPGLSVADDGSGFRLLPLNPPWQLEPATGQCRPVTLAGDHELGCELLAAGPVSPEAVKATIENMAGADHRLTRPQALEIADLPAAQAVPVLSLQNTEAATGRGFETVPAVRLAFSYDQVVLDWDQESDTRLLDDNRVVRVQRDSVFEGRCAEKLSGLGLTPMDQQAGVDYRPGDGRLWSPARPGWRLTWIDFQRQLTELASDGWQIQRAADLVCELLMPERWYGELAERPDRPDLVGVDLGVEVSGQRISLLAAICAWLDHAGQERIRQLLESPSPAGHALLSINERQVIEVLEHRLSAALKGLLDLVDGRPGLLEGRLDLPRGQLAGLAASTEAWDFDPHAALHELLGRLKGFDRLEPAEPPPGLKASLRPYQSLGLAWLQFLRQYGFGGILADDMGLGKTVQTLAHILAEQAAGRLDRPCLVIAPTSLMFNWRVEARRFAPGLKVLTLHGPNRHGDFGWIGDSDLVLTTYPLLARDIERLSRHDWHLLILDEAQMIRNPATAVSRHVRRLNSRHRLCLTGTPMENHLGDLWSLFDFLMPGLLGTRARFRRLFQLPIERHGDRHRQDLLAARIRPFFLRRTKTEVAPELPRKNEFQQLVGLLPEQQRLYERVRLAMHEKVHRAIADLGEEKSRIVVLEALLRLRQVCCDPRLLPEMAGRRAAGSAKLELLMDLLPELLAEGRRILVFSQFVSMLELIETELKHAEMPYLKLTGKTRDREQVVSRFQTGQAPIFLISLKAGGVGLNLTAADAVIHYDPWWNPAVEDQATDRAHRIGQDKAVFVYRLLTENTVEQRVMALQESKRGLAEDLLGDGGARQLSRDDLDALLAPLDKP